MMLRTMLLLVVVVMTTTPEVVGGQNQCCCSLNPSTTTTTIKPQSADNDYYDYQPPASDPVCNLKDVKNRLDKQEDLIRELVRYNTDIQSDIEEFYTAEVQSNMNISLGNQSTIAEFIQYIVNTQTLVIRDVVQTRDKESRKCLSYELESKTLKLEKQHLLREIDILNGSLMDVKEFKDYFEAENDQKASHIVSLENRITVLDQAANNLTEVNGNLQTENDRQASQVVSLQGQITELKVALKNMTELKDEFENENQKQKVEIDKLKNATCKHVMSTSKSTIMPTTQSTTESTTREPTQAPAGDCAAIYNQGHTHCGVYTISPGCDNRAQIQVRCDMTHGGGWTVIQRRLDGSVSFARNWADYKNGFGTVSSEYWIGNDILHCLTSSKSYQLLVEITGHDGQKATALYGKFQVAGESDNYRLTIENFRDGEAGDSLSYQNRMQFSTYDRDNDPSYWHCSQRVGGRGGWWYNDCDRGNMNGGIYHRSSVTDDESLNWDTWRSVNEALKASLMAIRPVNF